MDGKSIEDFLKMILKVEDDVNREVEILQDEIKNRESQLKKIISDVEANSEKQKTESANRLVERLKVETLDEQEKIMKACDVDLGDMERIFNENKSHMLERAFGKLSIDRWDS